MINHVLFSTDYGNYRILEQAEGTTTDVEPGWKIERLSNLSADLNSMRYELIQKDLISPEAAIAELFNHLEQLKLRDSQ